MELLRRLRQTLRGRVWFYLGATSFSASSFLALLSIARLAPPGALSEAGALLALSLVVAVVPGSVQLERAARAADGDLVGGPRALTPLSVLVTIAIAGVVAAVTSLPFLGLAMVCLQFFPALSVSAERGILMGAGSHASVGWSYLAEAAARFVACVLLTSLWGAAGFGFGLFLATAVAAWVTARLRRSALGSEPGVPRLAGPKTRWSFLLDTAPIAFAISLALLLVNADLVIAARVLDAHSADTFTAAAAMPKGVFLAAFAIGWLFFSDTRRRRTLGDAVRVVEVTIVFAAVAAVVAVGLSPLAARVLEKDTPTFGTSLTLALAMVAASGTWAAVNMIVALGLPRAWLGPGLGTVLLLGALVAPIDMARLEWAVLVANVAALLLAARTLASGGTVLWDYQTADLAQVRRRLGVNWIWFGVLALGVFVGTFLQQPGSIVSETKIDMALDPGFFLRRAFDMWEPLGYLGHVQNQSYGYFFPMGTYFWIASVLAVPAWIAQRLWMATLALAASLGVAVLAKRLGIGTPGSRVAAGAFYVCWPLFVTLLGFTSAAVLPAVVLPWMMVPLIAEDGQRRANKELRRAAVLSVCGYAFGGAVNAAALAAVLPAVAVLLVMGPVLRPRRKLALYCAITYGLASVWWLIPLLLLRRYGFNFLRYTETADVAASTQSLFESIRGSGYWLSYLYLKQPWLPAGWDFATRTPVVLASGLAAALAVCGLARLVIRGRHYLGVTFVVGVIATSSAYFFDGAGLAWGSLLQILNGQLSAFRNVSKFSFCMAIALSMGIAALAPSTQLSRSRRLEGISRRVRIGSTLGFRRTPSAMVLARAGAAIFSVALFVSMTLPVWEGKAATPGGFLEIPAHWRDLARWLDAQAGGGALILLPGAPFGEYVWGRPLDEVLQASTKARWTVRSLIPLGGEGSTRLMDGLERRLLLQLPDPFLADALYSAGFRYAVVRNDLDWRRSGSPRPLQVKRTLESSGGFVPVATFGAPTGSGNADKDVVEDLGMSEEEAALPPIVVYRIEPSSRSGVAGLLKAGLPKSGAGGQESFVPSEEAARPRPADPTDPRLEVFALTDLVVVDGGPENRFALDAVELTRGRPFVLSWEAASLESLREFGARPDLVVTTDGMQLRDFDFGLVHYNYSFVLGKKERPVGLGAEDGDVASGLSRGGPRPREIAPELPDWAKTTRRFEGVASITASSYSSWLVQLPELRPYAAFDRDLRTAWVTGAPGRSSGEWIEIRFDSPLEPDRVQITPLLDHPFRPLVRTIRIDTDAGSRLAELSPVETPQWIEAPKGPTSRMRVTLVDVEGEANAGFSGAGLREIAIPGVVVTERLEAPRSDQVRAQAFPDPGSGSEEQRTDMASRGDQVQLFVFERNRVHPALVGRQDEEPLMHRAFRLDRSGTYAIEGTVVPVPGASLDELIKIEGPVTIAASSQFNGLPEFRASNLLDGDTSTIWGAAMPRPIPNPLGIWAGPKAWTPFRTPVPVIEGLAPAPDPVPHIVLQMQRELSLSRMRLVPAERGPVSSPARVRIVSEYGNREAEVDGAGWASFEPLYGRTFRIEFPATRERISIDSMTGISTPLPVGFAELEIPELSGTQYSVPLPRDPFELPCGQGPNIVVDGHVVETAVKGTIEDLVFMRPLRLEGCTVFELSAGDRDHTLDEVRAAAPFSLEKVVLAPASLTGSLRDKSDAGPVSIERWGNRERKVRVGPGPARLLVINENFNGGWSAYLGRESLPAIRVDGWKQGFLVPAGAGGTVRLLYRPGYIHSAAITAGLVVLAILLWEAMVGSSRRHGDPAVGRSFDRSPRVSGGKGFLDKLPRFGRIPDSIRAATLVVSVTGAVGLLSRPAMPLSAVLATLVAFGPQRLRRPFRRLLPPLAGMAYAAATTWVSLEVPAVPADHKGPFGVGPQVLSAAAVLLIAIALGSRVWHPSRKRS